MQTHSAGDVDLVDEEFSAFRQRQAARIAELHTMINAAEEKAGIEVTKFANWQKKLHKRPRHRLIQRKSVATSLPMMNYAT